MATFFVEAAPRDGALIRFQHSYHNPEPKFTGGEGWGKYYREPAMIVTSDLNIILPYGQAGYCWEYVDGAIIPAQLDTRWKTVTKKK